MHRIQNYEAFRDTRYFEINYNTSKVQSYSLSRFAMNYYYNCKHCHAIRYFSIFEQIVSVITFKWVGAFSFVLIHEIKPKLRE